MPSVRVNSLTTAYNAFANIRGQTAELLRDLTSKLLNQEPQGVEAYWNPPISPGDAANTCAIWYDIEFPVDENVRLEYARLLIGVFTDPSSPLPSGSEVGVWIKPDTWEMDIKP